MDQLTCDRLKELLTYDPESGSFKWRVSRGLARAGDFAGVLHIQGYRVIRLDWKLYRASRLAWLYMTGSWPLDQIDHKNRLKWDDRWSNLRSANNGQNNMNKKARRNTMSGLKGVSWDGRNKKWLARITVDGVTRRLGSFHDAPSAHEAYARAAEVSHGEFARVS